MKRNLFKIAAAVTMLMAMTLGVSAAELTYSGYEEVPENLLERLDERIEIVKEAVLAGTLTEDQGSTLIQHLIDRFSDEDFGGMAQRRGQMEGFVPGSGSEECVLGLEEGLGLFSNGGQGCQVNQDGFRSQGAGRGMGSKGQMVRGGGRGANANGTGLMDGSCLVTE